MHKTINSLDRLIVEIKEDFPKLEIGHKRGHKMKFGTEFSVKEMEKQFSLEGPLYEAEGKEFIFDLSSTRWFYVNALLGLFTTFDCLRKKGNDVKMVLPCSNGSGNKADAEDAKKARDFLKRWNFFEELRNYFGDERDFFDYTQLDYLTEEQEYYLRSKIPDEWGNMAEIYTSRVIEISHFTEKRGENHRVSPYQIEKYLSGYSTKERILNALNTGVDWKNENDGGKAGEFVTKCLREVMENAMSHAEASIALVGAQTTPDYFIVSISDNGLGIPGTIKPVFELLGGHGEIVSDEKLIEYAFLLPTKEEVKKIFNEHKDADDSTLIQFATENRITSKPWIHKGLGLFLLKEFVKQTEGFFTVQSKNGSVLFDYRNGKMRSKSKPCVLYPGTLITTYLPRNK